MSGSRPGVGEYCSAACSSTELRLSVSPLVRLKLSPWIGNVVWLGMPPPSEIIPGMFTSGCAQGGGRVVVVDGRGGRGRGGL